MDKKLVIIPILFLLIVPAVFATPVIDSVTFYALTLGGNYTLNLSINASDSANPLNVSWFGSYSANFVSNISNFLIAQTLNQSGNISANNTANNINVYPVNFSLTNRSLNERIFAHNLSYQRVEINNSLTNHNYYCYQETATQTNLCGAINTSGTYSASANWNDGNRNTSTGLTIPSTVRWNYSVPVGARNTSVVDISGFKWFSCNLNSPPPDNYSLATCIATNSTLLQFLANITSGDRNILTCNDNILFNISQTAGQDCGGTESFYEEAVWWDFGGSSNLTYNLTQTTPSGATLVSGSSGTGILTQNSSVTLNSIWYGDWLGETYGTHTQNTANQSEAGGIAYIRRQLNVTNNQTFSFTNVSTNTISLSGWGCTSPNINIPTSGYHNASYEICSNGSILTRTRTNYNFTGTSNITTGNSYSGFLEIEINNTSPNITFNNILVNASPHLPSFWNIVGSATDNSTNTSNLSRSLINFTINISTPAIETSSISSRCSGFNIFSNYCRLETDLGTSGDIRTMNYTVRQFVNVSDSRVNGFMIYYPIEISRLTNWINRTNGTEIAQINVSRNNITITENSTHFTFIVGTNHSTSSLSEGIWTFDISYTTTTIVQGGGQESGGGGGGGGIGITSVCGNKRCEIGENRDNCIMDCGSISWYLIPESGWRVQTTPGVCIEKDFIINNNGTNDLSLKASVRETGDGSSAWTTIAIEGSSSYSKDISITVPSGTQTFPGRKRFFVKSCPPANIFSDNQTKEYSVNIQTSSGDNKRDTPFITLVGQFPNILELGSGIISWLFSPAVIFPKSDMMNLFVTPAFYLLGIVPLVVIGRVLFRRR